MKQQAKKGAGKQQAPDRGAKKVFSAETVKQIVAKTFELAEGVCDAEGLDLVHVEFQRESGGRILRIYIDKPDGVTLEDCSAVSRQVSDLLDVYLEGDAPYSLEVSSPGPERPISRLEDFNRFAGSAVKIRTTEPIRGQRNFTGVLGGLEGDFVKITVNGEAVAIPRALLAKARLAAQSGEPPC